jgi:uncharacterized protein (DUF58 family)
MRRLSRLDEAHYLVGLPEHGDDRTRARQPWYVAGLVLIVGSIVLQQPVLVVVGLLVFTLGLIPDLWYRFCLSGVVVSRTFSTRRAQIGDEVILTLTVENRKLLPLPRIEIQDEVPEEGVLIHGAFLETSFKSLRAQLVNILPLWAFQRVTRRYRMRCLARGIYTFGPMRVESGDPFGFLEREAQIEAVERLVVYPLIVPVERLGLPSHAPFGERKAPRRLLEDPLRVAGVRAYAQGDEPRRIHWKATARTGSLQSKVYESSTYHTLALFVDVRVRDDQILSYDAERLELALCTAASVASWGIENGYAVGLYANGTLAEIDNASPLLHLTEGADESDALRLARIILATSVQPRVAPSTHRGQIVRIQETLARLIPYFAGSIADVITREEAHLPFGSTAVYIGTAPALSVPGVVALDRLHRRGHAVVALLTGEEELPEHGVPVIRVGDADTWAQLLRETLSVPEGDSDGRASGSSASETEDVPRTHLVLERY